MEILISVVSGVILSITIGLLTYFKMQAKNYKKLLNEQKNDNIRNMIREEMMPLVEELGNLQAQVLELQAEEKEHINIILGSYKFRLIYLCKVYIRQKYMTQDQYDQLSEFYRTYHDLGGNGQAEEFYHRAAELPIHD